LADPRSEAVAPVKMIVPLGPSPSRATIRFATSRPFRKPPRQAISQILKYLRAVSSRMELGTLAPMLNTSTSIGPMADSICSTSATTSSSLRASDAKPWAWPPSALIWSISGCSLSSVRRVAQTV
jgi:hypothetical protein